MIVAYLCIGALVGAWFGITRWRFSLSRGSVSAFIRTVAFGCSVGLAWPAVLALVVFGKRGVL